MELVSNKRVVVVAAHPDDEWYGLGGTLLRLKEDGMDIMIVMVSRGERSTDDGIERLVKSRELAQGCGFDFTYLGYKGNDLFSVVSEIVRDLDKIFHRIQPDLVFTLFQGDVHQDHKAVNQSVIASLRRMKGTSLLLVETPYKHGFIPTTFVDVTNYMDKKVELFYRYFTKEINKNPDIDLEELRFIARTHGNVVGTVYAEAFVSMKEVIK